MSVKHEAADILYRSGRFKLTNEMITLYFHNEIFFFTI